MASATAQLLIDDMLRIEIDEVEKCKLVPMQGRMQVTASSNGPTISGYSRVTEPKVFLRLLYLPKHVKLCLSELPLF